MRKSDPRLTHGDVGGGPDPVRQARREEEPLELEYGGRRTPMSRIAYGNPNPDNHEPMIVSFDCALSLPAGATAKVYDGAKLVWTLTGIKPDPTGARHYTATGPS